MGATGAGTGEAQGVQDKINLYFATFAKSFAAIGTFVSGKTELDTYLGSIKQIPSSYKLIDNTHHYALKMWMRE